MRKRIQKPRFRIYQGITGTLYPQVKLSDDAKWDFIGEYDKHYVFTEGITRLTASFKILEDCQEFAKKVCNWMLQEKIKEVALIMNCKHFKELSYETKVSNQGSENLRIVS